MIHQIIWATNLEGQPHPPGYVIQPCYELLSILISDNKNMITNNV